ncbi:hypothetical protein WJX73_009897 [Symbiochloris irregularis]|uniref:Uncharacterized protein n=1 Tax=Symbiochloris irregularis TaxID=706552 RepID=A0AAW1PAL2_9CHLO
MVHSGGHYCHCWICCLNCYQGTRGCRLSFCCCCVQTGDPRGEEALYSRKTTDVNLCGCCGGCLLSALDVNI